MGRTSVASILFLSLAVTVLSPGHLATTRTGGEANKPPSIALQNALAATSSTPIIIGWGGPRGDESSLSSPYLDPSNPPSLVFPSQTASNLEMQAIRLKTMGFNSFRFSFAPECVDPNDFMVRFRPENLQRAIAIAAYFDFWIIVDYHGYTDLSTPTLATCWLNFWTNPVSGVVKQYTDSYPKLIWEPLNEPSGLPGGDNIPYLSLEYQLWINQTRLLGDQHWIVVQNLCSYSCSFADMADGFPTVKDPLNKVFISLHSYLYYNGYYNQWNNSTADTVAQTFYQAMLDGMSRTGWPVLNTEGGTHPLCDPKGPEGRCVGGLPPDTVLESSAGYTWTALRFMQTLTSLLDSHAPQRINWVWWPMASWTATTNAGIYGALQCDSNPKGWGCLLHYMPVSQSSSRPNNPPILSIPDNQNAVVGQTLAFTVNASDPDVDQTVSIATSGLMPGMDFNSTNRRFTFTPTADQAGRIFTVDFTATDSGSTPMSDTKNVKIQVAEAGRGLPEGVIPTASFFWLLLALAAGGSLIGLAALKRRGRSSSSVVTPGIVRSPVDGYFPSSLLLFSR